MFDAYFINYLPSYLRWQDVVVIVGLSLALSFLALFIQHSVLLKFNRRRHCVMSSLVLDAQNIEKSLQMENLRLM